MPRIPGVPHRRTDGASGAAAARRSVRARERRLRQGTALRAAEGHAVTHDQLLEAHGRRPAGARDRRRAPLAPPRGAEIDRHVLDDDGQICMKTAAALEFPEDLVVGLDEPQPHRRRELVRLVSAQSAAPADEPDDLFDEWTVLEEQRLGAITHETSVNGLRPWGRWWEKLCRNAQRVLNGEVTGSVCA